MHVLRSQYYLKIAKTQGYSKKESLHGQVASDLASFLIETIANPGATFSDEMLKLASISESRGAHLSQRFAFLCWCWTIIIHFFDKQRYIISGLRWKFKIWQKDFTTGPLKGANNNFIENIVSMLERKDSLITTSYPRQETYKVFHSVLVEMNLRWKSSKISLC